MQLKISLVMHLTNKSDERKTEKTETGTEHEGMTGRGTTGRRINYMYTGRVGSIDVPLGLGRQSV